MDQSELYYQIARAKYQSQEGLNREFLTRASAIMTFGGALVAAAALVLNLGGLSQGNTVLGIFAALLACFVGVASCCVCILKPWWWSYGPQLPELQGHVLSTQFSDEQMAEWAGDVFQQSVEDNTRSLKWKAYGLIAAIVCLLAEAGLLAGLSLVIYLDERSVALYQGCQAAVLA